MATFDVTVLSSPPASGANQNIACPTIVYNDVPPGVRIPDVNTTTGNPAGTNVEYTVPLIQARDLIPPFYSCTNADSGALIDRISELYPLGTTNIACVDLRDDLDVPRTLIYSCDPSSGSHFAAEATTPVVCTIEIQGVVPGSYNFTDGTRDDNASNLGFVEIVEFNLTLGHDPSSTNVISNTNTINIDSVNAQVNEARTVSPVTTSGTGFIGSGGGGGGGGGGGRTIEDGRVTTASESIIIYSVSWDCNAGQTQIVTNPGNYDVYVRSVQEGKISATKAAEQTLQGRTIYDLPYYDELMTIQTTSLSSGGQLPLSQIVRTDECVGTMTFVEYGSTSSSPITPPPTTREDPSAPDVPDTTPEPEMPEPEMPEPAPIDPPETPDPVPPTTDPGDGGCLIATAAFGSELAPQVQMLREIRDGQLLQTESGSAFMGAFNNVYYAFSPAVADLERENPVFKEAIRALVTPMLSTLHIMSLADDESSVLSLGLAVIALNLGMYVAAPAYVGYRVCRSRL